MAEKQWHRSYYDEWVAKEGLDLIRGHKVDNVFTQPLKPWSRKGGYGVQIQLQGTGELNAAYLFEIPPTEQSKPQKHLYEELIFILKGRGSTSVWYEGDNKNSFEWQAGSLFAIPLNAWHQHFNGANEPVRYLAVTTAPIMMNLIRNDDFLFDNDGVFPERYNGESNYFSGRVAMETFTGWDIPLTTAFSNFFADIYSIELRKQNRGVDTRGYSFELANGVLAAHMAEFPGGTFTKLHRHGPGAHVLWLKGEGYTLMWQDGGAKLKEYWGPGTMIVPPDWWWHQHCVVSKEPGQHVALKLESRVNVVVKSNTGTMKNIRAGGSQTEYEDVPPEIMAEVKRIFAEECEKRGTPVRMESVYSRDR